MIDFGYNDEGGIEPAEDFDWDGLDPQNESQKDCAIALLCWASTPNEMAAMRSILGIDTRRPVEIARSLGISRQRFNTLRNQAKDHQVGAVLRLRPKGINRA